MKYIISYKTKFGSISAESSNPGDLAGAYQELKRLAARIGSGMNEVKKSSQNRERGSGETATILRELNGKIVPTKFFSKPRTTGEVRDRVNIVSRGSFTSRKVSQALGILWKKKILKRTGKRNYYSYLR